jgi:hypothetical protein
VCQTADESLGTVERVAAAAQQKSVQCDANEVLSENCRLFEEGMGMGQWRQRWWWWWWRWRWKWRWRCRCRF